jgi:hypothetical protein
MGNMNITEKRLSKICSIALGENFCPNFIYEDIDFTKPSEIKEAYEIFEASADWIIYDRKTGKQLSPSKSWRKWQGAKMAAAKIGGDAEVSDKAWYHDNKARLMGEATDKELDAKDLEKMIKNPDPKRVKSYGGTKYVDMLKSKLAKLKESTDLDEAKQYVVIDKRGKVVSSRPMSTSAALDHYDSLGGNAKGYKVVATGDKRIKESVDLEESFDFEKTNVLTADEYDEVQDFKNFNKKDWKWNAIQRKFVRKVKVK